LCGGCHGGRGYGKGKDLIATGLIAVYHINVLIIPELLVESPLIVYIEQEQQATGQSYGQSGYIKDGEAFIPVEGAKDCSEGCVGHMQMVWSNSLSFGSIYQAELKIACKSNIYQLF
jgi:hypothetical protein